MTVFNVASRMQRDLVVAKYAKHLNRRSPVGDVTFVQSGRGVVIASESLL